MFISDLINSKNNLYYIRWIKKIYIENYHKVKGSIKNYSKWIIRNDKNFWKKYIWNSDQALTTADFNSQGWLVWGKGLNTLTSS